MAAILLRFIRSHCDQVWVELLWEMKTCCVAVSMIDCSAATLSLIMFLLGEVNNILKLSMLNKRLLLPSRIRESGVLFVGLRTCLSRIGVLVTGENPQNKLSTVVMGLFLWWKVFLFETVESEACELSRLILFWQKICCCWVFKKAVKTTIKFHSIHKSRRQIISAWVSSGKL